MDCFSDSLIRPTPADVPGERVVDILIARISICSEQRCGRHHLARLAVSALCDLFLRPRFLHWMAVIRRQSFNRDDPFSRDACNRRDARPHGLTVDHHRACAALSYAAAEFCTRKSERVAQDPQEWSSRIVRGRY
jgi:hypothetical protein